MVNESDKPLRIAREVMRSKRNALAALAGVTFALADQITRDDRHIVRALAINGSDEQDEE